MWRETGFQLANNSFRIDRQVKSITDPEERSIVQKSLENNGKALVEITYKQMSHFAGNMLEVQNKKKEACRIMSLSAYNSLSDEQVDFYRPK